MIPATFLTNLECSSCRECFDADEPHTVCPRCGKVLLARYDLQAAKSVMTKQLIARREATMWRYRELLPVKNAKNVISLGEGMTPVYRLQRIGKDLGLPNLWIKDEGANPTGSFKSRGMGVALSRAKEFGIKEVAVPSAGNAGGALAAYAARAGMRAHVFMPTDTPRVNIGEVQAFGAEAVLVEGTISDAAKMMSEINKHRGWFDCSTLKEPYRLEGKKTMGYEIAEQFGWQFPDVIIYPTGGGTGLIGMWKAFEEAEELGWITGRSPVEKACKRPRMVVVQSSGCAPIVRAFQTGQVDSTFWEDARTVASGLRVPKAFADYMILKVLYESGGFAVAVDDGEIISDMNYLARTEGIFACPEGAATLTALRALAAKKLVRESETVLLLNTGSGYKYTELFVNGA